MGRMSDGHTIFSDTSSRMSDTYVPSSEFFWMIMYGID